MIGDIRNFVERDRVIEALKAAPEHMLFRRPVENRYVDDFMRGELAGVGIWLGEKKIGTPDMWINVDVDTGDCWYYATNDVGGGSTLVHEEKNLDICHYVAAIVAKLTP